MTITHPEISRTCEVLAVGEVHGLHSVGEHDLVDGTCEFIAAAEVHFLHAFGEYDLVDGTCGREGKEREKDKVRNEESRAAGRQQY